MTETGLALASSSFNHQWTYDVFINFRGQDTRHGFTGNLHNALKKAGVYTFFDDEELKIGDEIKPALLNAIENSRMAITVFSKDYASSTFCLDELVQIHECIKRKGRLVLPIFYDVEPSEVRHQMGNYKKDLSMHMEKRRADEDKIQRWKLALQEVANNSGHHFMPGKNGYECQFIEKIVKEISGEINRVPLDDSKYHVGLESRVKEITSLLQIGSNDKVIMVGICGMGGLGKTTIARALYNSIADNFEGLCFLHDVKERSKKLGLEGIQEIILSKIVGVDIKIQDVNEGVQLIKKRFKEKKILLILDNVEKHEQLKKLAGACNWFNDGSRIIITTRDGQLLVAHGVESRYDMEVLNAEESLELLSWNAFGTRQVDPRYKDVLNCAVTYAQGLPLALEVIGSNLCRKTINEWASALGTYKLRLHKGIHEVLRVSYDSLEEVEKEIFLDIACFFNLERLESVKYMVEAVYDLEDLSYSIGVLVNKRLIKIDKWCDYIQMHDLIRDMGRTIVHEKSPNNPGKRSRLWSNQDIVDVLEHNITSDNLGILNLKGCEYVKEIPDLSNLRNLKELNLKNCKNLIEIHHSIGYLPKLEILKASECVRLKTFPRAIKLPCLTELDLWYCSNLNYFLNIFEKLKIRYLSLKETGIKKLLWSVCNLSELRGLCIYPEKSVVLEIPNSIFLLPEIEEIMVIGTGKVVSCNSKEGQEHAIRSKQCPYKVEFYPKRLNISDDVFRSDLSLRKNYLFLLDLSGNDLTILPAWITECPCLTRLFLANCKHLREVEGIPPSIRELEATNCVSLSLESKSIMLSEELHVAPDLYDCNSEEEYAIPEQQPWHIFCVPSTSIPKWFDHRSKGDPISFWFRNSFPPLCLCLLLKPPDVESDFDDVDHVSVDIIINEECEIGGDEGSVIEEMGMCVIKQLCEMEDFSFTNPYPQILDFTWGNQAAIAESGMYAIKQLCQKEDISFTNPYHQTLDSTWGNLDDDDDDDDEVVYLRFHRLIAIHKEKEVAANKKRRLMGDDNFASSSTAFICTKRARNSAINQDDNDPITPQVPFIKALEIINNNPGNSIEDDEGLSLRHYWKINCRELQLEQQKDVTSLVGLDLNTTSLPMLPCTEQACDTFINQYFSEDVGVGEDQDPQGLDDHHLNEEEGNLNDLDIPEFLSGGGDEEDDID